jgi:8-oxo-dGTP pyrophosphatase MutT (NUDIX family)
LTDPSALPPPIPAATVVLVRDGPNGLETLMLRKNAAIAFGGMWVFPGGRIDPGEGDDEDGARRAAVREAAEETGLVVDAATLVPFAHWTPPPVAPKRYATWFFLALAPDGIVAIDGGEIHEHVWVTPDEAIRRHGAGEVELAPPTFVTLNQLARSTDVAGALARAAAGPVEYFTTRVAKGPDGELVTVWHGDVAYEGGDLTAAGPRHRLAMIPGAWSYERTKSS